VLLGGGSFEGGPCGDNTLWILSVSFLGGACLISVLVAITFSRVPVLNRYVSGWSAKSMKEVEKDLARRNQQFSSSNGSSDSSRNSN